MIDRLNQAYFSEGKLISDIDTLVELGMSIGLDASRITDMLTDTTAHISEIREEELQPDTHALDYVPYFLIDDQHIFSGVLTVEDIVANLKKCASL